MVNGQVDRWVQRAVDGSYNINDFFFLLFLFPNSSMYIDALLVDALILPLSRSLSRRGRVS